MKPGRFFAVGVIAVVCLVGVVLAASGARISTRSATAASVPAAPPAVQATAKRPVAPISGHALALALGVSQAATTTQAGAKPRMAEEVFKNIQVLKGTTVDEFMGTMGLMAA